MRTAYIYNLANPKTNEIFYVGCSFNPELRVKSHYNEATAKDSLSCLNNKKHVFIKKMDCRPIIELIDEIQCNTIRDKQVVELELYWMWQFKTWGFTLTNNGNQFSTKLPIPEEPAKAITSPFQLFTHKELQKTLNLSRYELNTAIVKYNVKTCRVGKSVRFAVSEINKILNK